MDEDEINRRKELILSRSPTQLSEIHGLNDIPVPTKIQNLFQRPPTSMTDRSESSATAPKNFTETMYR